MEPPQLIEPIRYRLMKIIFTALRVLVGWHLFYEGLLKVVDPAWTSAAYIAGSVGPLSGFFHWILDHPSILSLVDTLNAWGLTIIGLGLILGISIRLLSVTGSVLLLSYYLAYPPLIQSAGNVMTEGNYVLVDKNLIESILLLAFAIIPGGLMYGLNHVIKRRPKSLHEFNRKDLVVPEEEEVTNHIDPAMINRRELIKNLSAIPVLGLFSFAWLKKRQWISLEEQRLSEAGVNALSSATLKTFQYSKLEDLKGTLPMGKIGNLELSRLFMGGNLIGGWAHARDLIYVSKLVKSYNTDDKVIHTLHLAEQCGINALLTNPQLNRIIQKYWRLTKGKIKYISDCGIYGDLLKGVQMSIDGGAHACYSQGEISDQLVKDGDFDTLAKALDKIRANGLPAGIGAHRLETIIGCVEHGLKPDFWVKTLHHHNYWSASPAVWNDNMYCYNPEKTIGFMNDLEEPWIAFKTLAAGAIKPEDGFKYAFDNGADFICVGMYDFQIVDDVNIALDVLTQVKRTRPWRA